MTSVVMFCSFFALGITADQLLKAWAVSALSGGAVIPVIRDFLTLVYVENRGAAFGIFPNATVLFLLVTLAVSFTAIWLMVRHEAFSGFGSRLCLTLIVTGGMGNAVDRVFRGFVVDYLRFEFSFFPWVFNLADIFVVCSAVALLAVVLFSKDKKTFREGLK